MADVEKNGVIANEDSERDADSSDDEEGGVRFPDLVLDEIFRHLSYKKLLDCAQVCRQWRHKVEVSSRWRSFRFGLDVNSHGEIPSVDFVSTYFHKYSTVELKQTVPFYVREVCEGQSRIALIRKFENLPLLLLDDVLTHCSLLRTLNLSSMRLADDYELAVEDIWSRVTIRDNRLSTLAFPKKFALSGDHLKYVFDKHPVLEHLSLSTAADGVTTDDADHPFGVFNSLKSLDLDIDQLCPSAVMKLLSLRSCYQLESLAVTKSLYLIDQEIFGPRMEKDAMTCLMQLTLMGSLVHLHLGIALTYVDVAVVLFNCCKLETLKIDYVDSDRGGEGLSRSGVRGLALSAVDVPQRLRSAAFGLVPGEVVNGLGGLMEMLALCANLRDVEIYPQSESGETPIELMVSPSTFSSSLLVDPTSWSKLSSFFFHVETETEWDLLKTILREMPSLKTLFLLVDAELKNEAKLASPNYAAAASGSGDIENLHLRISNSESLKFLRRVWTFWRSIQRLTVSIPFGEMLMDDVDFFDLVRDVPSSSSSTSTWRSLEELRLCLPPLIVETKPNLSNLAASLRFVKILTLPIVHFGPMSFEALVDLCPRVEIFTVGDGKEFFSFHESTAFKQVSGLGLGDLTALSSWKNLRECLLIVDVDEHEIESVPSVSDDPAGSFVDFAATFVRLEEGASLTTRRLAEEWRRSLSRLDRLEVVAAMYDFDSAEKTYRPLIFASRCGLGQLHFYEGGRSS